MKICRWNEILQMWMVFVKDYPLDENLKCSKVIDMCWNYQNILNLIWQYKPIFEQWMPLLLIESWKKTLCGRSMVGGWSSMIMEFPSYGSLSILLCLITPFVDWKKKVIPWFNYLFPIWQAHIGFISHPKLKVLVHPSTC